MNASKITIKGIFNGSRKLEIPFYQRAYVWAEEQWDRFLNDMELVTFTKKPYFIGSIILKAGQVNTWDQITDRKIVVDGQQRLTTLLIFLKAYCLKTGMNDKFNRDFLLESDEIALSTGINDYEAFERVVSHTEATPLEDSRKVTNVIKAFNYFLNNIEVKKIERIAILQNLEFVCIDLDTDEDEQQVFDTINSLGVKLTTAELLKNYFYSRNDKDAYDRNWVPTFEKDDDTKEYWGQEFEAGRIRKSLINEFFDSYFKLLINNADYKVSSEDKILYSRSDKLFSSYKEFVHVYCNDDMSVILDNLTEYAKVFKESFDPTWTQKCISNTPGLDRLNVIIFGLKNTTLIPYVLFIQINVLDPDEREKMYKLLESYIMRRIVTRESTKNYNRMFQTFIANKVSTRDELLKALNDNSGNTTSIPTDNDLERGFKESNLYNLQARGVIYLIETSLRNPDKDSTTLLGFDKYSLEHLMPKKWDNHWGIVTNAEERNRALLTLGNLAIITQSLNASIRDSEWLTKLNGKGNNPGLISCSSGLKTMTDVIDKATWDELNIFARAFWMYSITRELWAI